VYIDAHPDDDFPFLVDAAADSRQMQCDSCYEVFRLDELQRCGFCNSTTCVECLYAVDKESRTSYCSEECQEQALQDEQVIDDACDDDLSKVACMVCKDTAHEGDMLLCDGKCMECDAAAHWFCIGLPGIPNGDWYCAECEAGANGSAVLEAEGIDKMCRAWLVKHQMHLKKNYLKASPVQLGDWGIIVYPQVNIGC
jgi:hypothetical protein